MSAPTKEAKSLANTFYVYSTDDERKLADAKAAIAKGDASPKFVSELRFARLTEANQVATLYCTSPTEPLQASKPIAVAEHWVSHAGDGQVDVRQFCQALGKVSLPAVLKVHKLTVEDPGTLKLGYA